MAEKHTETPANDHQHNTDNDASDAQLEGNKPLSKRRKVRIGRLTTSMEVAAEQARVYRQTRKGEIPVIDGYRLIGQLAMLRQTLEASELEKRMRELEAALATDNVLPFKAKA